MDLTYLAIFGHVDPFLVTLGRFWPDSGFWLPFLAILAIVVAILAKKVFFFAHGWLVVAVSGHRSIFIFYFNCILEIEINPSVSNSTRAYDP